MRLIDPIQLKMRLAANAMAGYRQNIEDVIDSMPTVNPVRHGHWCDFEAEENAMEIYHCVCSECGEFAYGKAETVKQFRFYCPRCGAKMDGE